MEAYENLMFIGEGAQGSCWLCRRRGDELRRKVVVKQISLDDLTEDEKAAIEQEVAFLKRLSHPNVIGYYEAFKQDGKVSIVMQYAEGGSMHRMIRDRQGVQFPEATVLHYFAQVTLGLKYMHSKGILHRDLKPENILLNKAKTVVKIADFGISKELTKDSCASSGRGTPSYMAPEILQGRVYNVSSDIWSLGCILYELCELKKAFDGGFPGIVVNITKAIYGPVSEHWSYQLKEFIRRLLSMDAGKRPLLKELLTSPLILPVCMSIHLDLGAIPSGSATRARSMGLSTEAVYRIRPTMK